MNTSFVAREGDQSSRVESSLESSLESSRVGTCEISLDDMHWLVLVILQLGPALPRTAPTRPVAPMITPMIAPMITPMIAPVTVHMITPVTTPVTTPMIAPTITPMSTLHRTAPHRTAPHRTAPHRTAPHRTAPHRTAPTAPTAPVWGCCGNLYSARFSSTSQNQDFEGVSFHILGWSTARIRRLGYIQNQVLTSPHTGNPSFAVFVLTYFFFSWLETDLATYLLMQKSAFLGHRTYLLTCRRGVAGGARVLTYCSPELVFAYLQLVATSNIAFEYMAGLIPDWHCH